MPGPSYLAHWYYHVPDLILAALTWLLVLRFVLLLLPGRGGDNAPVRALRAITEPIVRSVGAITPRLVPAAFVVVFAAVWLLAARIALFVAVSATGVRLSMG